MQTSFFSVYLVSFVSGCYRNDEIQYSEKKRQRRRRRRPRMMECQKMMFEWMNIIHPFRQNSKGVDT